MLFNYFDSLHAITVHDEIIRKSGGLLGVLNLGLLESTLEHIKNDNYYPKIEDKVTHLLHSVNKNHSFQDGNKRSSIALSAYFLEINGYGNKINLFLERMENVSVYVASNRINKELLKELILSTIWEFDYSEELKFKLYKVLE